MFDTLLGRKFSSKCKQSIKCIKVRLYERRKKKQALLNFLKKDIADLLAIDEENNAFGRMDGLILETNHVSCYDMIEKFCELIMSQLPTLQKQRECSEEAMEAVATLIYSAARFSDLPELCDLRRVFTARYGSAMESSVNQEFVEKLSKKTFSKERKLKMMQEIANEFSINWDLKDFGQKKATPTAPPVRSKMDDLRHNQKRVSTFDTPTIAQTATPTNANVTREEVHSEAKEIHIVPAASRVFLPDPIKKNNVNHKQELKEVPIASPRVVKAKMAAKDPSSDEPTDHERQTLGQWEASKREIGPFPPYRKSNGQRDGVQDDRDCEDDHAIAIQSQAAESLKPAIIKTINIIPSYVKDRGLKDAFPEQEAQPVEKQPIEPRTRDATPSINPVPPYFKPSSKKIEEKTDHTGNLDMVQEAKPGPRSVRRNKNSLSSSHQNVQVNVVLNAEERIDRIVYGKRHGNRRGARSFDADYEDQDRAIDKLLMHYSRRDMPAQPGKVVKAKKGISTHRDVEIADVSVLTRVSSLPPERSSTTDHSIHQNDASDIRGARIHPRLPDYDELAARFIAMKKS